MIIVLVSVKVKSDSHKAFIDCFKANVPNVLAEDGCIEYFPAVDFPTAMPPQQLDPLVVTIIEKWENLDKLKAHLGAPHMASYREATKDMVEGMKLKILQPA